MTLSSLKPFAQFEAGLFIVGHHQVEGWPDGFLIEEIAIDPGAPRWPISMRAPMVQRLQTIEAGRVMFKDSNVTLEVVSHEHGCVPSYGFRFVSVDRVIVSVGDDKQGKNLPVAAMNNDILVFIPVA